MSQNLQVHTREGESLTWPRSRYFSPFILSDLLPSASYAESASFREILFICLFFTFESSTQYEQGWRISIDSIGIGLVLFWTIWNWIPTTLNSVILFLLNLFLFFFLWYLGRNADLRTKPSEEGMWGSVWNEKPNRGTHTQIYYFYKNETPEHVVIA